MQRVPSQSIHKKTLNSTLATPKDTDNQELMNTLKSEIFEKKR